MAEVGSMQQQALQAFEPPAHQHQNGAAGCCGAVVALSCLSATLQTEEGQHWVSVASCLGCVAISIVAFGLDRENIDRK